MISEAIKLEIVEADLQKENKLFTEPPCQYTSEELKIEVAEAVEDYKAGRVYTMEEMRAKHPRL